MTELNQTLESVARQREAVIRATRDKPRRGLWVVMIFAALLAITLGIAAARADDVSGGMLLKVATTQGICTVNPGIALQWTAPTTNTDGTAIGTNPLTYNLYGGPQGGTSKQLATGLTGLNTCRTDVSYGTTYCYTLTAVEKIGATASPESAQTNPACAAPTVPTPNPPTNLTAGPQVQTADTNAYKRREAVDGYTWVVFGTVPAGTSCDATHSDDGYMPVARANVTKANRFDTFPLVAWAKCG